MSAKSLTTVKAVFQKYQVCADSGKSVSPQRRSQSPQNGAAASDSEGGNQSGAENKEQQQRNTTPTASSGASRGNSPDRISEGAAAAAPVVDTNTYFIPATLVHQALWDLEINPVFSDLAADMKSVDVDGNGRLDLEEFKTLYLMMYRDYATNPQRAMQCFVQLDRNGDGQLQIEELRRLLVGKKADKEEGGAAAAAAAEKEEAPAAPKKTSTGPGKAHGKDVKVTAVAAADKLSEEEFQAFWDSLDTDRNDVICPAEFVAAMCPGITSGELNEMLNAYNLEPNGDRYAPAKRPEA